MNTVISARSRLKKKKKKKKEKKSGIFMILAVKLVAFICKCQFLEAV